MRWTPSFRHSWLPSSAAVVLLCLGGCSAMELAAVGQDEADDPTEFSDDDAAPESPPSELESLILSTRPADDAADFYYRDCVEVWFSKPVGGGLQLTLLQEGSPVGLETRLSSDGLMLEGCPERPLEPLGDYQVELRWESSALEWTFSVSELGQAVEVPIAGVFTIDPASFEVVEPAGVPADLLGTLGAGRLLVELPALDTSAPADPDVGYGLDSDGDGVQEMCAPAAWLPLDADVRWENPGLWSQPFDLEVDGSLVVRDLRFDATMAPDASHLGGVEVEGWLDTRPLDALAGAGVTPTCDLLGHWGVVCAPCEDGPVACLQVSLRGGRAEAAWGDDAAAEPLDFDFTEAECDEVGCGCSARPGGSGTSTGLGALFALLGLGLRRARNERS